MSHQAEIGNGHKRESGKKSNNPLVSIIIPTYNRAHLIGETLDSILNQIYSNWECIIVDDGSTDRTEEVVQQYLKKDRRFYYYHRPKDRPKGANACRNYGFEMSKGEFINWFDDDDLMVAERLDKIINRTKNNYSEHSFYTSEVGVIGKSMPLQQNIKLYKQELFTNYIHEKLKLTTTAPLWPRDIFYEMLMFNENISQSQEYEFYSRLLHKFKNKIKMVVIPEILLFIRLDHDTTTSSFKELERDKIESFFLVRKTIMKLKPSDRELRSHYFRQANKIIKKGLAFKKYYASKIAIDFIVKTKVNWTLKDWVIWYRFLIFYNLIKFLNRGETRFKRFLRTPQY